MSIKGWKITRILLPHQQVETAADPVAEQATKNAGSASAPRAASEAANAADAAAQPETDPTNEDTDGGRTVHAEEAPGASQKASFMAGGQAVGAPDALVEHRRRDRERDGRETRPGHQG